MSGITTRIKTNKKECLKLMNHINSFLFEQQFGELEYAPKIVTEKLRLAAKELAEVINKSRNNGK